MKTIEVTSVLSATGDISIVVENARALFVVSLDRATGNILVEDGRGEKIALQGGERARAAVQRRGTEIAIVLIDPAEAAGDAIVHAYDATYGKWRPIGRLAESAAIGAEMRRQADIAGKSSDFPLERRFA